MTTGLVRHDRLTCRGTATEREGGLAQSCREAFEQADREV